MRNTLASALLVVAILILGLMAMSYVPYAPQAFCVDYTFQPYRICLWHSLSIPFEQNLAWAIEVMAFVSLVTISVLTADT